MAGDLKLMEKLLHMRNIQFVILLSNYVRIAVPVSASEIWCKLLLLGDCGRISRLMLYLGLHSA